MARKAIAIELSKEQKAQLEKITRSHRAEHRLVERAKIILACAEGKQNKEVAAEFETSVSRIGKWRKRFAAKGIAGLDDEPRPGAPATYGQEFRDRLLSKLESDPPKGLARWDCPTLAKELEASQHAVWRALKKEGIYLHRSRSWCISTDPEFTEKAANIIGLYLTRRLTLWLSALMRNPAFKHWNEKQAMLKLVTKK